MRNRPIQPPGNCGQCSYTFVSPLLLMLASGWTPQLNTALNILGQIAAALDYAHLNGVIHRDVKPANVMLHRTDVVKIGDFGIAKVLSASEHTRTGILLGTPGYMSPEQIRGGTVDGRSDQFSLAVMAFQLLTGVEPFRADSVPSLLQQILNSPAPSAHDLNKALPAAIDGVLRRGLEKYPASRYASCAGFVNALKAAVDGTSTQEQRLSTETLAPVHADAAPQAAAESRGSGRRTAGFVAVVGMAALSGVLWYSGILPQRIIATNQAAAPAGRWSAKSLPDTANITPARATNALPPTLPATSALAPASDPGAAVSPKRSPVPQKPPGKSARARELYKEEAIRSRDAGDREKALRLLRESASLGDAHAMVELGVSLMNDSNGAPPDYTEALQLFHGAADAGDSSAMVYLGGMYLLGNGVDEDFAAAADWFQKGADAGDPSAMYDLGTMYENGQGVNQDVERAKRLYRQAAGLGNDDARMRLIELAK